MIGKFSIKWFLNVTLVIGGAFEILLDLFQCMFIVRCWFQGIIYLCKIVRAEIGLCLSRWAIKGEATTWGEKAHKVADIDVGGGVCYQHYSMPLIRQFA